MSTRPLKILVWSENRSLLRGLSRFLDAFGYEVQQAARRELAALALDCGDPDVLLVDAEPSMRDALELCRSVRDREPRRRAHVFLLVTRPDPEDLIDALEAGVDDFLAQPIVYGELLVRLRAGERALEFERRMEQQGRVELLSGLLSRSAFHEELGRALSAASSGQPCGSCAAVEIDLFEQLNAAHGRAAGDAIVRAVAARLSGLCGESDSIACFGRGRFAVWLPGMSDDAAAEWAERALGEIHETSVELAQATLSCSASFGLAEWSEAVGGAEALMRRAREALDWAKTSGGQCVVRFGEYDAEAEAWEALAEPGKLFEQTLARDVMTPWPLTLRVDQTADQAAAIFHHTGLRALPVVDADGNFAGLVSDGSLQAEPSSARQTARRVSTVMTTDVATCDEDSPFADLIGLLEQASGSRVVILRNGTPVGYLTLKSLAAMSKPVEAGSFGAEVPYSSTSEYLRVADPCSMDAV